MLTVDIFLFNVKNTLCPSISYVPHLGLSSAQRRRPLFGRLQLEEPRAAQVRSPGRLPAIGFSSAGGEKSINRQSPLLTISLSLQIDSFWQTVASEALGELAGCRRRRLWLSTAGQGVAWLHFRIEGTPKYYSYGRYRDEDLGFEEGEA